jgi:hypothetical protein
MKGRGGASRQDTENETFEIWKKMGRWQRGKYARRDKGE